MANPIGAGGGGWENTGAVGGGWETTGFVGGGWENTGSRRSGRNEEPGG